MATLYPARIDVTSGNGAARVSDQQYDNLYVISGGSYNEPDHVHSSAVQDTSSTEEPWQTHNYHVTEDHYHVADDTSVLVNQDVMTSQRHRQSRGSSRRSGDRDPNMNSAPTAATEDNFLQVHYCHEQQTVTDRTARNQLIVVSVLCALLMAAQITGGILSNSLAIVTDATHMASDLASFLVSLLAIWLATKSPSRKMTLGYHRAEVLGALVSIVMIWIVTAILVYLAIRRIQGDSYHIEANEMLIVAAIGVAFNLIMGFVLHTGVIKTCRLPRSIGHNHSHGDDDHHSNHHHHAYHEAVNNNHDHSNQHDVSTYSNQQYSINSDHQHHAITGLSPQLLQRHAEGSAERDAERRAERHTTRTDTKDDADADILKPKRNINIQAATIHVLGDFIQSIGVLIAAIIIKVKPEYHIADPVCTFVFSVLVLITTVPVLRDVLLVLVEAKPRELDYHGIYTDLGQLAGVRSVHSLSLWSLTVNKIAATVHIAIDVGGDTEQTLAGATRVLRHKYGVYTSTVQVEHYTILMEDCKLCQD